MNRDSDRNRQPYGRVVKRAGEGHHPFGQVVDPDPQRDEEACLHEPGLPLVGRTAHVLGKVLVGNRDVDEEH